VYIYALWPSLFKDTGESWAPLCTLTSDLCALVYYLVRVYTYMHHNIV